MREEVILSLFHMARNYSTTFQVSETIASLQQNIPKARRHNERLRSCSPSLSISYRVHISVTGIPHYKRDNYKFPVHLYLKKIRAVFY